MNTPQTTHRNVRITLTKTANGIKETVSGRIVTVLRANRKYTSKYFDKLGITKQISLESNQCRIVLKGVTGVISVMSVSPNVVYNSNIIKYKS